jgi:carbon monoxide dehydrogenase subunit G
MELKGTHKFTAPPQTVWDALHNADILRTCIPGIDEMTWKDANSLYAKVAGFGPLKGPYYFTVPVVEQTAPTYMKMAVNRTAISGSLDVTLSPEGAGTLLSYTAVASLSGPASVIDNPLTRPMVDGQINQIFSKLESQIR